MTLRHFTPGDAPVLRERFYPHMELPEILGMIADWDTLVYDGRYFEMFAILRESQLAGYCSLYEHSRSVVSLGVEVAETERRKGCAFLALTQLLARAKERGYSIVQDQIRRDNEASIRLHEKLGFETDGYVYQNQKGQSVLLYLRAL